MFHRLHLDLEASSDHRKKNIKNFIYDALDDMYFSVKSHRVNNRGQEIPAQIQKKRARRETLLNRHRRIFCFFFFFSFSQKIFLSQKTGGHFFLVVHQSSNPSILDKTKFLFTNIYKGGTTKHEYVSRSDGVNRNKGKSFFWACLLKRIFRFRKKNCLIGCSH